MADPVSSGLEVAAKTLEIIADIQEAKNAPDVRDAVKKQDEVNAVAEETKAVAERDIEAVRKNLAE